MNKVRTLVLFSVCLAAVAIVDTSQPGTAGEFGFRIRSDFTAPLNANQGWAGGLNENVVIDADKPFRVRLEVGPAAQSRGRRQFSLQYRRNAGAWTDVEAHDFPKPADDGKTPRVSIVSCARTGMARRRRTC